MIDATRANKISSDNYTRKHLQEIKEDEIKVENYINIACNSGENHVYIPFNCDFICHKGLMADKLLKLGYEVNADAFGMYILW